MSTPANPFSKYSKKGAQSSVPVAKSNNEIINMDYKNSVYNGLLMTAGILGSTFVVKKIKKDMAPNLTTTNAVALGVVTVLSRTAIDYAKEKDWISKTM